MSGGYVGKILRVDLTSGKITDDRIPEDVQRSYIGGYGLGLKLLYDALSPGYQATDAENPLIFLTGPLTGLPLPGASNLTLTTKNFDTGFTVGRSHTHGVFGIRMKAAGYDGIVVTGKSERPVYLWVHDGVAELRDASGLWGKDTHDTEDLIKVEVGQPNASVAVIGPAGENLCAGALIENDKNHSMSHSGGGAVMGSKKLKAIACFGESKIPTNDGQRVSDLSREWMERISRPGQWLSRTGGQRSRKTNQRGQLERRGFVAINFRVNQCPEYGLGMSDQSYTTRACPRCPIGCSCDIEMTSGPHKGFVATLSGGGENLEGAGSIIGVTEPGTVFYLADLFDRLGVEGGMAGVTMAMAFEAYEKGLITSDDTGGLKLKWGDAEAAEKLLRMMVAREGFGDILAKGVKHAAEIIGGDAPNFAAHIKGTSMNLHEWRPFFGTFFAQIVGSGAGWPAGAADGLIAEPDAGYPEFTPRFDWRAKPLEVKKTGILKFMNDSTGLCWFITWGLPDVLWLTAESLKAATGWDWTPDDLTAAGERIMQLERAFNVRHGLTPRDDHENVSPRLLEAPNGGPGEGKTLAPYLHGMINEYYRLMGWDEKTGKPWRSTLNRSGLSQIIPDMWG